ncbi:MAG TPA: hypothetical protein VJP45_11170 [Candidatus Limnocylindria bacterium]|nr:hypothetical protein [Candidatus Limnocylindria bacterium]
MEEFKRVEKRTEVRETPEGGVTNVNVGPDSTAVVDEKIDEDEERETEHHDLEEDRASDTIIRQEETIEKHQR